MIYSVDLIHFQGAMNIDRILSKYYLKSSVPWAIIIIAITGKMSGTIFHQYFGWLWEDMKVYNRAQKGREAALIAATPIISQSDRQYLWRILPKKIYPVKKVNSFKLQSSPVIEGISIHDVHQMSNDHFFLFHTILFGFYFPF